MLAAAAASVAALAGAGSASADEPLDPARNTVTPCDALAIPGHGFATRSAKSVVHVANKCGVVGVEVEFQSRRDAAGRTRDYAFMSTMSEGLNIYDVTNPRVPVTAGNFASAGWQFDIQVRGNLGAVSFDGLANDPGTASTCLKTYFPGSNDQGDDILRFVYNPSAAAMAPVGGLAVPPTSSSRTRPASPCHRVARTIRRSTPGARGWRSRTRPTGRSTSSTSGR